MLKGFVFALLFLPNTLWAADRASWKADLKEVTADGSPILNILGVNRVLEMNQRGDKVTSFDFTENPLIPNPPVTRIHFKVKSREKAGCGSWRYRAQSKDATLTLLDHSRRICDDVRPATWEVQLQQGKRSRRYFQGNPKAPVSTPACENLGERICITLYQPVKCTVSSYDGEALKPAIEVMGSNTCDADGAIEAALCARGLDPERLDPSEIECALNPPLPE